jgi:hypothetical protein
LVGIIVAVSILVVNNNSHTFFILGWCNFKNLIVGWIDKEFSLKLEELEPSWVGAPDLHISCFSRILDIPRLVVESSSDGLGLLMEIPGLGSSSVWCLDDHVSIVN